MPSTYKKKLALAIAERDSALADSERFQSVLSKTEEMLSQLQTRFEADLQNWSSELEGKRAELEQERSRVVELETKLAAEVQDSRNQTDERLAETEQLLADGQAKLAETEEQLKMEKRWHSETLLKLEELQTQQSNSQSNAEDVETLQKQNDMEQKWHAETLQQLKQVNGAMLKCKSQVIEEQERSHMMNKLLKEANSDVTLLQEKLSLKNLEIVQLSTENDDLKRQLEEASTSDLQDEVSEMKGESKDGQIAELRYQLIELNKKLRESNSTNEYLKYRLLSTGK